MKKPVLPAILSLSGQSLTDEEKFLFQKYNPVGFNLFARNIENKQQVKKLIKDIKETLERDDIIFAVDQEGGRVRRLREPEFRSYLPQHAFGDLFIKEAEQAAQSMVRNHSYLISSDLKNLGFNMNYAPVLDVAQDNTSPVLKSRCFGNDEKIVAKLGKTMIDEYINQGISPCIKHMPGHGRAVVDPHLNLPIITCGLKELEKDFYPFIYNQNSPTAMTAHIIIPEIDDKLPITQSKKAIDFLIRSHLGFSGLLVSDAIDMKALKGSIEEKAQTSLAAGCDIICYALGKMEELVAICNNCCKMNDKSLERLEVVKNVIKKRHDFSDIEEIAKKYTQKAGRIELYDENYDATEVLNKMAKK